MNTIRRWSVLDCRTHPASAYDIVVVQNGTRYALCKTSGDKVSVLYANPEATRALCIRHARNHIKHLRRYTCIAFQIKSSKTA